MSGDLRSIIYVISVNVKVFLAVILNLLLGITIGFSQKNIDWGDTSYMTGRIFIGMNHSTGVLEDTIIVFQLKDSLCFERVNVTMIDSSSGSYTYLKARYNECRKSGEWRYYDSNNRITRTEIYNNEGKWSSEQYYGENGLIELRKFIEPGVEDSFSSMNFVYYKDGSIQAQYSTFFAKNRERKEGLFIDYYQNGVVKSVGRYVHGVKTGVWLFYDEKGSLKDEQYYVP